MAPIIRPTDAHKSETIQAGTRGRKQTSARLTWGVHAGHHASHMVCDNFFTFRNRGTCDRKEATQLCYEPRALGAFRMPCPYVGLDARNHIWHVHLDMHQTRTARDGKSRIKRTDGVLPIMST